MRDTTRCSRCVLPATYPGITFDDRGVCSACTSHDRQASPAPTGGSKALLELVSRSSSSSAPYQVVVPLSGGKDSAYALYAMRRIYGLRTLAVNFDNGFRSRPAEDNLHALVTSLETDLVSLKPDWGLMRALYAAFLRDPGEFCTVCNAMGYLVIMSFVVAEQQRLNARLPIVGAWSKQLEAMPGVYSFDVRYFHDVIAAAGLSDRLRRSALVNEQCLDTLLNAPDPRQLALGESAPVSYLLLPDHLDWNYRAIGETLRREAGWRAPADSENETHFDCTAYPAAKYLERRKYGFSQSTITYCALVRSGQMTRNHALAMLDRESIAEPAEFEPFLNSIGLTPAEVNWNGRWHPQRR